MEFLLSILKDTWYILILMLVVGVINLRYSQKIKGYFGEKAVADLLSKLDHAKYKVINDIMLKNGAKTSQIDHVIVSNYGIFVIETKNYKGLICGNESDHNWTHKLNKSNNMLNPIHQNQGHIKALKEALREYPDVNYASIIAFTEKATLKIKTSTDVVNTDNLLKTIRKYSDVTISDPEKEQIYLKLLSLNIKSKETRKAHVEAIQNNLKDRESKINVNICPRCGGGLVQKNGKYGLFKGCENFPRCRFIVK